MSAGFSWNQRNTGGHRPPLQCTEPLFNRFLLEFIPQCKLHHTRRGCRCELAEVGRRICVQRQIGEVHIVERIERLGTELEPMAFDRHPEYLADCNIRVRSEEHTSELQSHLNLVCRL